MRVLDVAPLTVFPPHGGSLVRMSNLLRHLAREHEVRQFSSPWAGPLPHHEAIAERTRSPGYRECRYSHPLGWLAGGASRHSWHGAPVLAGLGLRLSRPQPLARLLGWADVAIVEYPWQFAWCRERRSGPVALSTHNVESDKFPAWGESIGLSPRRGGPWFRYVERAERYAVAKAELVTCVSDTDRARLIERFDARPERVVTVPNGVDTELLRPADPAERMRAKRRLGLPHRPVVLYSGGRTPPNLAGLGWVRRLAARGERLTFLVVGGVAEPGREHNLVLTGEVDDLRPYYAAADMAICPIAHGGGTKIKLFDAFGMGLPVVCFAHCLVGLDTRAGEHLLVADEDEHALLARLNELASDERLAAHLGRATRELAVERYDWSRSAERLSRALSRVVSSSPSSRSAAPAASSSGRRPAAAARATSSS